MAHKHTPYVIILVKVAEEWAQSHGGSLPSTREEKKDFKELIKKKMISMDEDNYKEAIEASFKVFAPRGISKYMILSVFVFSMLALVLLVIYGRVS